MLCMALKMLLFQNWLIKCFQLLVVRTGNVGFKNNCLKFVRVITGNTLDWLRKDFGLNQTILSNLQ